MLLSRFVIIEDEAERCKTFGVRLKCPSGRDTERKRISEWKSVGNKDSEPMVWVGLFFLLT